MLDYTRVLPDLLQNAIDSGGMSAASVRIAQGDRLLFEWTGGRLDWAAKSRRIRTDDVFLIASITKPMVASAVVTLAEEGRLDLDDSLSKFVAELTRNGKESVTLRHCFTHTSGLPDMVPGNVELRKANAPLRDYVAAACGADLLFEPGTGVSYQSSGILLLAEAAERITGQRMRNLLAERVLAPCEMKDTHLGWRPDSEGRRVSAKVVHGAGSDGWNHNSPYWRDLGAPWGGAHSTARDIAALLRTLLRSGEAPNGERVFGPGTVRMLITDQIASMPGLPGALRRAHGWGLGWRIKKEHDDWPSAIPSGAFGHSGATGTLAWADPRSGVIFVLLTNDAGETGAVRACSNVAAAALCGN